MSHEELLASLLERATIELFAADLVLSDPEGPVVSTVGGRLAEAAPVTGVPAAGLAS